MKILITGGSGLLGSKIAEIASRKGNEVYSGYHSHESTAGKPVHLNICNESEVASVFTKINPEVVVHAAALTNVDECERDKELANKVNIEGTKNIVKSSVNHSSFLVYVSTDYVFSGEKGSYKETDTTNPINHYGVTKLEGEKIVASSDLEWCITRPSVIYGSRPAAGKDNFALWIYNKLKNNEKIKIITDQIVSPTLNINLAEMILEITERKINGIYHTAGATPLNRYDFTVKLAETLQLDKELIFKTTSRQMNWTAKRPENTSLNVGKASKTLRQKPLLIKDALKILRKEISD